MAETSESEVPQVDGLSYALSAGAVIALMWCWYLLEQFTSLRVTRFGQLADQAPLSILFPVIASVIAPAGMWIWWMRSAGIAKNGVFVMATVQSCGLAVSGYRDITFVYEFDGREYSKTTSIPVVTSQGLNDGDALKIIVDKRNPKRIVVA